MADATAAPARPYAPSWADAIAGWIDRLPGPWWAGYIFVALLFVAYVVLLATLSTRGLFGQDPAYFAYGLLQASPVLIYHFLSRGGAAAWGSFRAATDLDDAAAAIKRAELTTTPARPALAIWAVTAAIYTALLAAAPDGFDLVGQQPLFVAMRLLTEAFVMVPMIWLAGYLLFRQMRLVSQLHRSVVRVDLLQPGPLHAMSRLTARSAIVTLGLLLTAWIPLPNVSDSARLALIVSTVPFMIVPIAAFVVPLRGMQALLGAEKVRRLAVINARLDGALSTLHEVVHQEAVPTRDEGSARLAQTRIDALNKAISSLLQEREFISRLSTWPWDTTTFRTVASAVLLPIVLFALTRVLERFVL